MQKFKYNSKAFSTGEKWFDVWGNEYFIVGVEEYPQRETEEKTKPFHKVIFKNGEETKEQDLFRFQTNFLHHSAFRGLNKSELKVLAYARSIGLWSIGLGEPGSFTVEDLIKSHESIRASLAAYNKEIKEIRVKVNEQAYKDAFAWAQEEAVREFVKNMTVQEFANLMSTGD